MMIWPHGTGVRCCGPRRPCDDVQPAADEVVEIKVEAPAPEPAVEVKKEEPKPAPAKACCAVC